MDTYTQLSGTRVVNNIFLMAFTLISRSIDAAFRASDVFVVVAMVVDIGPGPIATAVAIGI